MYVKNKLYTIYVSHARRHQMVFLKFFRRHCVISLMGTLVEAALTFYMLQACMQGIFFKKNIENSDCAQGKNL